jgi:RNA polymerase sigma factor (sigma-70 family)
MNPGKDRFTTTRWSIVLSAGHSSSPKYQEALAALCGTYWYPLYAFLRRQGHDAHAAEDFVQAFFARMLEKHDFRLADPSRGKFRSFLLTSLKNFVANEFDRANAQKRGGGQPVLSLDVELGEELYVREPADTATPETLFERAWAMTVLDRAMAQLDAAVSKTGEQNQFQLLKQFLTGDTATLSYKDAGAQLGMSEGAVKVAVHRLRRRFREALKDEVAQTVGDERQVDEEIQYLIASFAR